MKLTYIGQKIGVIAQNQEDLDILIKLISNNNPAQKEQNKKKPTRVISCPKCGKGYKGRKGIGRHKLFCKVQPSSWDLLPVANRTKDAIKI